MTERLGFSDPLLFLAVGGIALFALGVVLGDSAGFVKSTDDSYKPLHATGTLLEDLGAIAVGGAILLAAIAAEGHSTAIRAVMVVVAVALIFKMLSFSFGGGISATP